MAQHRSTSLKTRSKKRIDRLPAQGDPPTPSIALTGRRRDDHFRVDVDGVPVWLSGETFKALLKLVVATLKTESGRATISRLTIHRLRKSLGKRGEDLILNGSGEEYYLMIPKAKTAERMSVAPCFFELVGRNLVATEDAELLRKHCRRGRLVDDRDRNPPHLFTKPNGNRKETKQKRSGN